MCRYDGSRINNNFVRNLKKFVDFVPVCPEESIGLGTPRKPIRLVKINGKKSLYQPSSEKDLTEQMTNFIQKFEVDQIDCPVCNNPAKRIISLSSFELKGGGWYKDGYQKSSEKKSENKSEKT